MLKKIITFFIFIFAFLFFASTSFASVLYLSPGSRNIPAGSTVSVNVGINTAGESVNGVSAYLSYPADKLDVAWISYGSRFDIAAEGAYGGGNIRISRGSVAGVVGNVNIATIGFRGKTLGKAAVAFIGGSAAARSSDSSDSLNLGGSTGGAYTVVAPQPTTATPTGQQNPVLISNVKVSDISTNSAVITWETNEKSDSTVEYGLTPSKYFLSLYDNTITATHTAKLEGEALTPGANLHFIVKSKDEKGNAGASRDYAFQLKGYSVKVWILDSKNNPVEDTDVYLYTVPQKSRTNENGEVHFANVTAGKHLVVVKLKNNFDKTEEIEVLDSPLSQNFTLAVDTAPGRTYYASIFVMLLFAVVIISVIAGLAVYFIRKRRQNPPEQQPPIQL